MLIEMVSVLERESPLIEIWVAQTMDKPLDSISQEGWPLVAIEDPMVGALDGENLRTIDLRPIPTRIADAFEFGPRAPLALIRKPRRETLPPEPCRPHPRSLTTGKYRHASYQASASIFDGTPRYLARIRPQSRISASLGIALRRNPKVFGHRRIDKGEYLGFEGQPAPTRKRNNRRKDG